MLSLSATRLDVGCVRTFDRGAARCADAKTNPPQSFDPQDYGFACPWTPLTEKRLRHITLDSLDSLDTLLTLERHHHRQQTTNMELLRTTNADTKHVQGQQRSRRVKGRFQVAMGA